MSFYDDLKHALHSNDKAGAVNLVITALDEGMALVELYENVLADILNTIDCDPYDEACIWLEHQISSITRTILEVTYPYVVRQKKTLDQPKHVVIACPENETHELGALMGANLFEYEGFTTTYIGADTPTSVLERALSTLKADYVVLSVSNAYHLFDVDRAIARLRKTHSEVGIIGSGRAFVTNRAHFEKTVDAIINDHAALRRFIEEVLA